MNRLRRDERVLDYLPVGSARMNSEENSARMIQVRDGLESMSGVKEKQVISSLNQQYRCSPRIQIQPAGRGPIDFEEHRRLAA